MADASEIVDWVQDQYEDGVTDHAELVDLVMDEFGIEDYEQADWMVEQALEWAQDAPLG